MAHSRSAAIGHLPVATQGDPGVAEDFLPISYLIFWLSGCHHGVSPQHFQAGLNELAFRFNRGFYPFNAFQSLFGIRDRAAAPPYDGLYSGAWQHPKCSVYVSLIARSAT